MAERYEGNICPRIQKILEKRKELSGRYLPQPATRKQFQVKSRRHQFTVDLEENVCSYRKWQLTGIPCPHAISAIHYNKEQDEKYVDPCYFVETQRKIYKELINPINGEHQWPESEYKPKPPQVQKRQPGRPKTKRKNRVDEGTASAKDNTKLKRIKVAMNYGRCGVEGHNIRTCKKARVEVRQGTEHQVGSSTNTNANQPKKQSKAKKTQCHATNTNA
ncbi:hypothetical protein PTKIN_Ptkin02bG0168400 [Pterospermum kingtungense]